MMSITPYSCPPYAVNCLLINNVTLPSSSVSFSNFNFPPYALTRSRSRDSIVLASADDQKQRRKTARGLETEPLEALELKFGHLLGENPQKTFAKVLVKKSNPDASYLEIEKSMKGKNGLHLKRPLQSSSTEGKERPLTDFSNGQSVSSNTKGNTKSLSLIRPVMRREGKRVISRVEPTRLGSDAKAIHMESNSKEVTHEVLLRRPSKQTHEFLGFAGQPTTPHLPSKKIEDSDKGSLEDAGLLRRPEAIRIDYNLRKIAGDSKAKEVVTEDSLGSKTDSSNTMRLGSDAKAIHMESDSKEVTHEVLQRRPSKQTHEFLEFAGQPTTPHLPSKKIEDSAKRSLEDTGLLRRPEAIRIDYNLRKIKIAEDSKAKEVVTEDSLGSKTGSSNAYAAADKRGEAKRGNRILLDRPTLPINPMVLTSYEIDSQELHGSKEDENRLQRSVSESKGDGSSFHSRKPKSIGRSVPSSIKSDKMSKADIPSLIATPQAKTEVLYTKEQLQDCKEAAEIKAEELSNGHEVQT